MRKFVPRLAPSRFGPLHALAAGAVLLLAVAHGYWTNFFGGSPVMPPPPAMNLLRGLAFNVGFFVLLAVALWLTTASWRQPAGDAVAEPGWSIFRRIRFKVLGGAAATTVAAFGIAWVSLAAIEATTGVTLPQQNTVEWLKTGIYPNWLRAVLVLTALFEAPLVEEPLFRGIVFRGLLARSTPAFAMTLSGLLFAIVHVNAASFVPLWFLGIVFAYAYWRTGTLLVPMAMHLFFNGTSLALFFAFPGLAQ